MRFLITGGAGFVGSHLVDRLVSKGHKVIVIDNLRTGRKENLRNSFSKIKFLKSDISVQGRWEKLFKNVDVVFHLAAVADIVPSINNPKLYFNTNVKGTLNVLENVKKYRVKKIIYAASSSSYGIPKKYPTKENEFMDPKYPYALTKKMGEDLLIHWSKVYKINVISLRFFNIYGERSRTSGSYGAMFGVFLAQKINKKPFTVVGSGNQRRDFTYISDIINALIKSINVKEKQLILNIGSGKCYSVNYIIKLLKGKKIYIPKRPGEPNYTWSNISKAKKILKWTPKVSIEEGVKKLLKNLNYWQNAPLWNKESIKIATKDWFKYLK